MSKPSCSPRFANTRIPCLYHLRAMWCAKPVIPATIAVAQPTAEIPRPRVHAPIANQVTRVLVQHWLWARN